MRVQVTEKHILKGKKGKCDTCAEAGRSLAEIMDERDEARKIAADLRDLVPWIESEPWIFSWENS